MTIAKYDPPRFVGWLEEKDKSKEYEDNINHVLLIIDDKLSECVNLNIYLSSMISRCCGRWKLKMVYLDVRRGSWVPITKQLRGVWGYNEVVAMARFKKLKSTLVAIHATLLY